MLMKLAQDEFRCPCGVNPISANDEFRIPTLCTVVLCVFVAASDKERNLKQVMIGKKDTPYRSIILINGKVFIYLALTLLVLL